MELAGHVTAGKHLISLTLLCVGCPISGLLYGVLNFGKMFSSWVLQVAEHDSRGDFRGIIWADQLQVTVDII